MNSFTYLLDTNILSDLVRHPAGKIAQRIKAVGEERICTNLVVAAELRYGAYKKGSVRLTNQLEVGCRWSEVRRQKPEGGDRTSEISLKREDRRPRA